MPALRTIILAAGKGTRMKSAIPKVLHPVCGKPMIEYVLGIAGDIRSLKTYVVLGHGHKAVAQRLDKTCVPVLQKKLLGTADAVKCVQNHFKGYLGDVVILCGDTPLLQKKTIRRLIQRHRTAKADCTFLTAVVDDPRGYGRVIRDPKGHVLGIREEKDAQAEEKQIQEINVGVYCFKSQSLFKTIKKIRINPKKKEFYLTDIIAFFLKDQLKIQPIETSDAHQGLGVNDRRDLAFAEWIIRQRINENFMQQGVTITDPQTTYIDADVKIGKDTVLYPFTVIEHDVRIGRQCRIGPFARIRPGTRVGDQVEVGNFTEISRSDLGEATLMKHFGFLGDAVVGRNVNIGAGVVTANFDGKNKNKTLIKDKAFVGSDSILVAPLTIGREAVTGAGCVVPKNTVIAPGQTVVGVPVKVKHRKKR